MHIKIRHYKEVHPKSTKKEEKYFIQMTFDSDEEKCYENPSLSHFDMYFNQTKNIFEYGNIELFNNLKGIGLGRKLVEGREELARRLGCFYIERNL